MKVAKTILIGMLAGAVVLLGSEPGYAQDDESSAKGIYYDSGSKRLGAKFHIRLVRGDSTSEVPTGYKFRTGDRVHFTFEANEDCYVYVLNRTFDGDPDSLFKDVTKGIVYDEEKLKPATRYRLLFPTPKAGTNNRLDVGKEHVIPHTGSFIFDEQTGIEKLYIVLSRHRVDPIETVISHLGNGEAGEPGGEQLPTKEDQEVLDQLMKGLGENTTIQYGDDDDVDGYAVEGKGINYEPPEDDRQRNPVLIVVNLAHYR